MSTRFALLAAIVLLPVLLPLDWAAAPVEPMPAIRVKAKRAIKTREIIFLLMISPPYSFCDALYPACCASASVMNLPFFVVPYQRPLLWYTPLSRLTHTFPLDFAEAISELEAVLPMVV